MPESRGWKLVDYPMWAAEGSLLEVSFLAVMEHADTKAWYKQYANYIVVIFKCTYFKYLLKVDPC